MTMAVRCRLTCRVLMAMPGMLTFRVAMTLAVRGRLTCRVLMAMPDLLTFWVAMTVAVRGRLICIESYLFVQEQWSQEATGRESNG